MTEADNSTLNRQHAAHLLRQVRGEVAAVEQVLAQVLRQHRLRLPVWRDRLLAGAQRHVGHAKVDARRACSRKTPSSEPHSFTKSLTPSRHSTCSGTDFIQQTEPTSATRTDFNETDIQLMQQS